VIKGHAVLIRRPAPITANPAQRFVPKAVGLRASAPTISELGDEQGVVPRPNRLSFRVDQIDIGLEQRGLIGKIG
jgi:hypothetical protein